MKKNITKLRCIVLCFLIAFNVLGAQDKQLVKIEDPKFLKYLKDKIPDAFVGDEMNIKSEAVLTLTRINVLNKKISNFKGIEYFVNLEEFDCTYNLASSFDLSKNKKLKIFICWENKYLTKLDLSANTELLELNCGDNIVTSLDISKCIKLKKLFCEQNQLIVLNLSNNKALTALYCSNNRLTSLNLSQNLNLQLLECINNPITSVEKSNILIEIKDNYFKQYLKKNIPNAFVADLLNIKHNNVTQLKILELASKNISSIEGIEYFVGIEKLDLSNNNIIKLDLSKNVLITNLKIDNNPFNTIDLRGIRFLENHIDFTQFFKLVEIKVHKNIRDNASFFKIKQSKGKTLNISVYDAFSNSTDYILINADDIPTMIDNKYANNS